MTKQPSMFSWSRIREWNTCHWRYGLKYDRRLSPKRVEEPLRDGKLFHSMLEYIYSRPTAVNVKNLRSKLRRMIPPEEAELRGQITGWIFDYLDHMKRYANQEPDAILLIEFPFKVPLDGNYLQEAYGITAKLSYIGVIDLIVIRKGRVEVWDHKCLSNHPSSNALDHAPISYPQLGLYPAITGHLGHPIHDSIMNVFGKRRKEDRIARYPVFVSEEEAWEWESWLNDQVGVILTSEDRSKTGLGSLDCSWCSFRYACLSHQREGDKGLERALKSEYEPTTWEGKPPTWKPAFPAASLRAMKAIGK